jgi:hypothetical protein
VAGVYERHISSITWKVLILVGPILTCFHTEKFCCLNELCFQDSESKKCEKKEVSGPPLQTASMSVRALIEEKIIQKRITNPQLQTPLGQQQQSQQQHLAYASEFPYFSASVSQPVVLGPVPVRGLIYVCPQILVRVHICIITGGKLMFLRLATFFVFILLSTTLCTDLSIREISDSFQWFACLPV